MTKRMLVDATHPEETRVAIVDSHGNNNRLEDLDFGLASKPLLKGNIYLAKVMRVEPSLQAAFVEYGGNRHGFLSFSEIHPDYFRIPVSDRPEDEEGDLQDTYDMSGDMQGESDDMGYEAQPSAVESLENTALENAAAESAQESVQEATGQNEETQPAEKPVESEISAETIETAPTISIETIQAETVNAEAIEPASAEAPAEVVMAAPQAAPQVAPERHPLDTPFSQAESMGHNDHDIGLIMDFGNAAINPPTAADLMAPASYHAPEVQQPAAPQGEEIAHEEHLESVGGEVTERFIRRQPRQRRYKIQEVVKRGMVMLIQVVKEERGNKGAALTTYLSLAGRYCVLMPNTDHGGGVSRKITNHQDRRRMKEILDQLEIPEGMAVILRTAGMEQDPPEIQRDQEYLLRLWNGIREQTLQSSAPSLIYEEANLIKRSVRDLYTQDIQEILVSGQEGYEKTRDFMRAIMPDEVSKIKLYQDPTPLFFRYNVESQIEALHNPVAQLRSGGYLVINPTEALVSIDVNSGRATRERHIEETAAKTNLEAADEIARQLRLRDLAGLVVIDFIDMEDPRNNSAVERRMKEAMRNDRARLQIGRMSPFGLLELSRQRLRPSLLEINCEKCPHCAGVGFVRSVDSAALSVLRDIEEEGIKQRSAEITVTMPTRIAMYLLNQKRGTLTSIEKRYDMQVLINNDDTLIPPDYKLERLKTRAGTRTNAPAVTAEQIFAEVDRDYTAAHPLLENASAEESASTDETTARPERTTDRDRNNRRRRGGRDRNTTGSTTDRPARHERRPAANAGLADGEQPETLDARPQRTTPIRPQPEGENDNFSPANQLGNSVEGVDGNEASDATGDSAEAQQRRRRRGRRGGRRRSGAADGTDRPERGERRPRFATDGAEMPATDMPINIPTSIFELDTTPKDIPPRDTSVRDTSGRDTSAEVRAAYAPQAFTPSAQNRTSSFSVTEQPRQAEREASSHMHEIVNPPTDKPKGGWWRRLTGQEN